MTRSIDRQIREFNRDKFRLQMDLKKMEKNLENSIKKKESKSTQKMIAQNILKQKGFIKKYDMLQAKMEGVKVHIAQITSTQVLTEMMQKMGHLLDASNKNVNINNIQQVIEKFNISMEEQQNIGEMMEDAMDQDEEEIEDADVDKYLDEVQDRVGGGGGGGGQKNKNQADTNFGDMIADLKK